MEHAIPHGSNAPPAPAARRSEWQIFWRFFRYLRPYKSKVVLYILLVFVGAPLGQFGAFLNKYLVDDVLLKADTPASARLSLFWVVLAAQAGMWLVGRLSATIGKILRWYFEFRITVTLRKQFYDHLQRLSLRFHHSRPVGEQMYRSTADTQGEVLWMITDTGPELLWTVYQCIWAAVLISVIDGWVALLIVAYMLPHTLISHYWHTRWKGAKRGAKREEQAQSASLRDGVAGMKTVKAFGQTRYQARRYTRQLVRTGRARLGEYFTVLAKDTAIWGVGFLLKHGMWLYVGYQTMLGRITLGEFTVIWTLGTGFREQLEMVVLLLQHVRVLMVPAERILETLDQPVEVADAPGAISMPALVGRIEFDDVWFGYEPERPVLRGVSFTLEPGQSAAFVGPSGAGKSTLLSLLLRLYDPDAGAVRVDGLDLRSVKIDPFREQVGVVLQDTFLFGGSVAEAIRYGRLDASDEEVRQAARLADIAPFIESLPHDYDTELEEGTRLSGGQRQRMGIARAMIRDPRVLLLDEATASLDPRSEAQVMQTLEAARAGRTTLMIAHRLVTVARADVIHVLDKGVIVESGTHAELLALGGLYARLWAEQTGGNVESRRAE